MLFSLLKLGAIPQTLKLYSLILPQNYRPKGYFLRGHTRPHPPSRRRTTLLLRREVLKKINYFIEKANVDKGVFLTMEEGKGKLK